MKNKQEPRSSIVLETLGILAILAAKERMTDPAQIDRVESLIPRGMKNPAAWTAHP